MWYEFSIFGFLIVWAGLGLIFSDSDNFIKRHFLTIGFVFISWFHAIYYLSGDCFIISKGGKIPICYSDQPVTYSFIILFLFVIGILAIYFDEGLNKQINSDKGLNIHIKSDENKNIVIPDRDYSSLYLRKEYCPHCDAVIDARATICLSCGEQLNKKIKKTEQRH